MNVTRKVGTAVIAMTAAVSVLAIGVRTTPSGAVVNKTTANAATYNTSYAQWTAQDVPVIWQPTPVGVVEAAKSVVGMQPPNPLGDFQPEYITGGVTTLTTAYPVGSHPTSVFPFSSAAQCESTNVNYWEVQARPGYWFGLGSTIALQPALSPLSPPTIAAAGANTAVTFTTKGWKWSNGVSTQTMDAQDVALWLNMDKAQRNGGANAACGFAPGFGLPDQVVSVTYPGGLSGNAVKITFAGHPNPVWLVDNELSQIVPLAHAWDTTNGSSPAGCSTEAFASVTQTGSDPCSQVFSYLSGLQLNDPIWTWADGPYRQQSAGYTGGAPDGNNVQVANADYSGPVKPHAVQTIDYRSYSSMAAETNALEANTLNLGYVDPTQVTPSPGPGKVGTNKVPSLAANFRVVGSVPWGATDWLVNYDNSHSTYHTAGPLPLWADELNNGYFRAALQISINQLGVIKSPLNGYGIDAFSAIPTYPASSFSSGITNPYPYSATMAKGLMKKSGWNTSVIPAVCAASNCGTVAFPIPKGAKAVIQLLVPLGDPVVTAQINEEIATIKGASDIQVTPNFQDLTSYVQPACLTGAQPWELCALGTRVFSPDTYPSGEELFVPGSPSNPGGYGSTEMSALVPPTTSTGSQALNAPSAGATPVCVGKGACDVASASPQVICLPPGCPHASGPRERGLGPCTPSRTTACVTVVGYKNGKPVPSGTPVTVHFVSPSTASPAGSWCQQQNPSNPSGTTDSSGQYTFPYTSVGTKPPPHIASFCIMRAVVGGASNLLAIDQTNGSINPYKLRATPRKKTLFGTAKAMLHLSVVLPPKFADPTTIISAYPSFPGACGSISPLVGKTNLGRATLVYHPSTVPGSCTLVAEEAFTGAKSHKVVIRQKAP